VSAGWHPARAPALERIDRRLVAEAEPDVVETLEEALPSGVVERERLRQPDGRCFQQPALDVDGQLQIGVGVDRSQELLADFGAHDDGDEPVLGCVVPEDVTEAGGDDGPEAVLLDGPDGVLPGRSDPEVRAADQDRCPGEALVVQRMGALGLEAGVLEGVLAEPVEG